MGEGRRWSTVDLALLSHEEKPKSWHRQTSWRLLTAIAKRKCKKTWFMVHSFSKSKDLKNIALLHIANVEKLPITSLGCPLILRCKNFQVAHFVLNSDIVCHEAYNLLLKLSQPAFLEDLYAFSYNPKSSKEMSENGWKLIDPISDFGRMGIPNRYWTITDANRNYETRELTLVAVKPVGVQQQLVGDVVQHF
ncbi:hypothetical protein GH733_018918 [Mirounga leonina]|nr:hypothetical protein GH733_018918 [Mirounga leonina]